MNPRIFKIGDVATVKGGKRLPAGAKLTEERTAHPYLRVMDFFPGGIDASSLMFVPDDVFPQISRYTIDAGDIFVSIVGTIGVVGRIPPELHKASLTENAAKISVASDSCDARFLMYFLMSQ